MTVGEASFTIDEHRGRLDRARSALKENGLAAAICVAPESLFYLAGYEAHTQFSSQALVFGADDGEPTLVIRDVDIPGARATSWVTDVRAYHFGRDDPAVLVKQAVADRAAGTDTVGLEMNSYALPGSYAQALIEALRPRRVEDCSLPIARLRLAKSAAELQYSREAARIGDAGLQAFFEHVRPGVTEIQLAGKIEAAMREAGTEYPAMPTWLGSGPRRRSHCTPSNRVIEAGDVVRTEFAGVSHRYHAAPMQIACMGKPPGDVLRADETGLAAMAAGVVAGKPGGSAGEMERAAYAVVREMGGDPSGFMRFGYGLGIAYPPSWLEPLDIIAESEEILREGMTIMLHVAGIGGTYEMTAEGLKLLCGSQPLFVV